MVQEESIEDLKKLHEEDKKQTRTVTLTKHELNYLIGCVESDDDYAKEYVMDNYEFENWEKDENNEEYKIAKKLEKICQDWLDNLYAKLNEVVK